MSSIWRARTLEAANLPINLSARPRRIVRHFRRFLENHPISAVDVGSRWGLPGELEPLAPYLDLVAIEPDRDEAARLRESLARRGLGRVTVLEEAVGAPAGTPAFLHVTAEPGKSSLLEPDRAVVTRYGEAHHYAVREKLPIAVRPLGELLAERNVPSPDLLKLDVQGSELAVLGTLAPEQWDRLLLLETEAEFVPLYRGQPLFRDLDAEIAGRGFELFHLNRAYGAWGGRRGAPPSRGQLQFADAFYLRTVTAPLDPVRLGKLMILAAVYGFGDYGNWVLRQEGGRLEALDDADLFASYFAPFEKTPGAAWPIGAAFRQLADRLLFLYLRARRWNGLRSDNDRVYPLR